MTITACRLALLAMLCLSLVWVSGALSADAWHELRHRDLRQCLRLLTAAGDSQQDAVAALVLAAEDLHRAERVCSIWRDTSAWYQGAYLHCAYRPATSTAPSARPPMAPTTSAPTVSPTTVTRGTPLVSSMR